MPKKKNAVRADGRIAVQVYIGRVDGKRKYKTVYGNTQKEADAKALELRLKLKKGIDLSAERDTFGAWTDRWLACKKHEVGESQYDCYRSSSNYLRSGLENTPICNVRTCDIQQVVFGLATQNPHTKKPSSKKVLSDLRMTARQIFDFAIANRAVDYNPAIAVSVPQAPKERRRALTDTEILWIEQTPHRARRIAMIMLYSGARRGEALALEWPDFDLNAGTVRICKTVKMVKGRPSIKHMTKTEAGMRIVDIPQTLVDFLRTEYETELLTAGETSIQKLRPLVCPSASGKLMSETSFKRLWESYLCDLNFRYGDFSWCENVPKSKFSPRGVPFVIERFTSHCLRHTFATMLYHAGVDVLTARDQLGHADIKTTLQIYTHLDKQYKRHSMKKVDNYIQKKRSDAAAK